MDYRSESLAIPSAVGYRFVDNPKMIADGYLGVDGATASLTASCLALAVWGSRFLFYISRIAEGGFA